MAKVITSSLELSGLFAACCSKYNVISFATAWAGSHSIIDVLFENREKIKKSTVGLHFYQTSPEFIKRFESVPQIQYDKRFSTDIFHPKVYLFYNDVKNWSAIVGSSNLTGGGFGKNIECNIYLTSETDSDDIFHSLNLLLKESWKKSEPMGDFFEEYEEIASQSMFVRKKYKRPANPNLSSLDWNNYIKRLEQNTDDDAIRTRLDLLDKAQELFSFLSLKYFPGDYSLAVMGLIEEYEDISDWRYFGSTKPNGKFRKNYKNKYLDGLSNALDNIPLSGDVNQELYQKFVDEVRNITGFNNPITICTRLLTMKRPDIFVCVAGRQNQDGEISTMAKLCNLLGSKRKTITLDNYWDEIILSIKESEWYQTPSNMISEKYIRLYNYRAAMLDALYY